MTPEIIVRSELVSSTLTLPNSDRLRVAQQPNIKSKLNKFFAPSAFDKPGGKISVTRLYVGENAHPDKSAYPIFPEGVHDNGVYPPPFFCLLPNALRFSALAAPT